jgi:hypothetical protein
MHEQGRQMNPEGRVRGQRKAIQGAPLPSIPPQHDSIQTPNSMLLPSLAPEAVSTHH